LIFDFDFGFGCFFLFWLHGGLFLPAIFVNHLSSPHYLSPHCLSATPPHIHRQIALFSPKIRRRHRTSSSSSLSSHNIVIVIVIVSIVLHFDFDLAGPQHNDHNITS
jgi:hypothetical protein